MKSYLSLFILIFTFNSLFAQKADTTKTTKSDTSKNKKSYSEIYNNELSDSSNSFLKFNPSYSKLPPITMPLYRLSDQQKRLGFRIEMDNRIDSDAKQKNWTDVTLPANQTNYNLDYYYFRQLNPLIPIPQPPKKVEKPLSIFEYNLPTRQELDILELLWAKDDVTDTTLYSSLDTTMNVTFLQLRQILQGMEDKKLVSRKIVSPRNEFNIYGIMIEMSMKNRRNRIFEYHSRVDEDMMRRFIDANAYMFKSDSSIVDLKQLRAARKDSSLLPDLDRKLKLKKK